MYKLILHGKDTEAEILSKMHHFYIYFDRPFDAITRLSAHVRHYKTLQVWQKPENRTKLLSAFSNFIFRII